MSAINSLTWIEAKYCWTFTKRKGKSKREKIQKDVREKIDLSQKEITDPLVDREIPRGDKTNRRESIRKEERCLKLKKRVQAKLDQSRRRLQYHWLHGWKTREEEIEERQKIQSLEKEELDRIGRVRRVRLQLFDQTMQHNGRIRQKIRP